MNTLPVTNPVEVTPELSPCDKHSNQLDGEKTNPVTNPVTDTITDTVTDTVEVTPAVTPEVTPAVTPEVHLVTNLPKELKRLLSVSITVCGAVELMRKIGIKHIDDFRHRYIFPALQMGLLERTQPESPHSPTQKYRLTEKGGALARELASQQPPE